MNPVRKSVSLHSGGWRRRCGPSHIWDASGHSPRFAVVNVASLDNPMRMRQTDAERRNYVLRDPKAQPFLEKIIALAEGGFEVVVMCDFGRHRSVALADKAARILYERGYAVRIKHWGLGVSHVLSPGGDNGK
jgi:hypothetical protein